MFHLAGWYESIDPSGAYAAITAIQDPAINTSGDDIRVSAQLPFICGAAGLTAAATLTAAQMRSPSLRTLNNLEVRPLVNAVVFGSPPEVMMFPRNPRAMVAAEDVQFWFDSTPGAGAEAHYGLTWMCDGALPVSTGEIFTVGATTGISLSAGAWVNGNITFNQVLPSGTYDIVGMRAEGTNLVAARLVFPGDGGGGFRPGVPAVNAAGDLDPTYFRFGGMGSYGQFDQDNPCSIDALGITDTAQTIIFDLIKVG